jgi:hypothetical protein
MTKKNMFYDLSKMQSYNALLNFLLGGRGIGKTYGMKKWSINDFLKTGKQFIYLRRYKSELKDLDKFFNAVSKEFPDVEFEIKGRTFYINKKVAGYAVALSTALTKKSAEYPKVNKIIYDEFLIMKSNLHYIPNEPEMFLEFFETVARMRDDVRAFFLGNATSENNPYFVYFNLRCPDSFYYDSKRFILIENIQNSQTFMEAKRKTRFGQLINGTDYASYSINNEFFSDDNTFIKEYQGRMKLISCIRCNRQEIGLWQTIDGRLYACNKINYDCPCCIAYDKEDVNENYNLGMKRGFTAEFLRRSFRRNEMIYQNIFIKNVVFEVMRKIGC